MGWAFLLCRRGCRIKLFVLLKFLKFFALPQCSTPLKFRTFSVYYTPSFPPSFWNSLGTRWTLAFPTRTHYTSSNNTTSLSRNHSFHISPVPIPTFNPSFQILSHCTDRSAIQTAVAPAPQRRADFPSNGTASTIVKLQGTDPNYIPHLHVNRRHPRNVHPVQ